jgi:hypothetical protein
MRRQEIEDCIRKIGWPAPPADLRARIIGDASVVAAPVAWSDRVWFSRAFRWSMAAAVVALIALGQWAGRGPIAPAPTIPPVRLEAIQAAVIDAGLPADVAASLAHRALMTGAGVGRLGIGAALHVTEAGGEQR